MKCPKCKAENADDAEFCTLCYTRFQVGVRSLDEDEAAQRIKEKHVITVDGVTIWLKHVVYWWPDELGQVTNPVSSEYEKLPDIVVHGHTHKATMERKGGTLLINPGSPTFPHYIRQLGTVGLLSINSGKAEAQVIQLK